MNLARRALLIASSLLLIACGGGGSGNSTSNNAGGNANDTTNEQTITIQFGSRNIPNTPFTSVTICVPGSIARCQTIDQILVDTGSSGLRIMEGELSSVLSAALPSVTQSGRALGECVSFADGSGVWGALKTADVRLGTNGAHAAQSIPIHIIGTSTLPNIPPSCPGVFKNSTAAFGAKGILGIGPTRRDCGTDCTSNALNNQYFSCNSLGTCTNTALSLALQIGNPVAALSSHNNGTLISLPTPPAGGADSLSGKLVFGIGTSGNNALGSANILPIAFNATVGLLSFTTRYKGNDYASFIDSGSNALFFPDNSIPDCLLSTAFFCPAGALNLSATQVALGSNRLINFIVSAADGLGNNFAVLPNLAGGEVLGAFDWGLPFFYGRNVFTAIEGRATPVGNGPYFAH